MHTAALLLTVGDQERQLIATTPQAVAGALARVVRLGPPQVGERTTVAVEADVLEDLFHDDEMRRLSALTVAGAGWAWTLAVTWEGGEHLMSLLDGPDGATVVVPGPSGSWALEPIDATAVWRRLSCVLPSDAELATALSADA